MASVNQPKMYSLSVQLLNQTKYWYHKNQKINMASVNQPNMDFKLCIGLIKIYHLHRKYSFISLSLRRPLLLQWENGTLEGDNLVILSNLVSIHLKSEPRLARRGWWHLMRGALEDGNFCTPFSKKNFGNWEDPNKFRFRLHQTTYHISCEFYHPFFLR
jgi:hypothetical protein